MNTQTDMGTANHGNLKVYQASAGAGKTFRLAVEYIRLLILRPDNYKHILAVTFTNKATSEMKERILSQLYGIWRGLPQSEAYLRAILSLEGMGEKTDDWARTQAGEALRLLLADYGHFRVETIDAYFQSVLREVARELALPNDFRLELRPDWAIQEAVGGLFDKLATDERLLRAMLNIVEARIANTDNWNVREALTQFGKHLFSEQYLAFPVEKRRDIGDLGTVEHYKDILRQWEDKLRRPLGEIGQQFGRRLRGLDIEKKLSRAHRTDTAEWMRKTAEGRLHENISNTIRGRAEDAEQWLTAKTRGKEREALLAVIEEHLRPLLRQAIAEEERVAPLLNTIDAIRRHIDSLTFVNTINDNVRQMNERAHRFLLADTAHFLHELIDGSDIPFLYERAGVDFRHIMIDEFQDTSRLQWENFEPLVKNSLDMGKECLIVGDVKQSIYRWRNSDWSILNSLGQQHAYKDRIEQIVQPNNFRSSEVVVQFNNGFFKASNRLLCAAFDEQLAGQEGASEDIALAYGQLLQTALPKQAGRGYVRVTIDKEESGQLAWVGDTVKELLEHGIAMSDIAILTRKNKHIADIMRHLLARDDMPMPIELVSGEAFQLDASPAVRTIVLALRVLDNPSDRTLLVNLALLHHAGEDNAESIFLTQGTEALWNWLPEEFALCRDKLPLMSLHELVEWLIRQFRLDEQEGQAAYLFTFLDKLDAFLKANDSDVRTFLAQWDLTLHETAVATDNANGIRLMTIHKSKGLEFSTVIVPFCDWDMQGRDDGIVWGDTSRLAEYQGELDRVPLVPLPFTKTTNHSLYHEEYLDETKRFFVDNLNLMYVAFTRAVDNLIILCDAPREPSKPGTPPRLTANWLLDDFIAWDLQEGQDTCERGKLTLPLTGEGQEESNPLLFPATPKEIGFSAHEPALRFRQSRQAVQFLKQDDEDDVTGKPDYLNEGNIFHALLARLRTAEDAGRVLAEAEAEGMFSDAAMSERMRQLLAESLADEQAGKWFAPHWHVINERSIVERDSEGHAVSHRPDRVITDGHRTIVIDYKTGQPRPEHHQQVQGYMQLLTRMEYPGVEGYLWYVRQTDNNRIVRVEQ